MLMSSSGLTQRRKAKEEDAEQVGAEGGGGGGVNDESRDSVASNTSFKAESYRHNSQDLTLMEEIVLLGLKDSEVLRGAILIELSFRNRVSCIKDPRKPAFADRTVKVDDDALTGEVLLDETLRYLKTDSESVANWIDLLSGETWNLYKIGYQLKQVRERIAKGLVDKGVLRTEKKSFVLFDLPTHPVSNPKIKEALVQRLVDALLGRGPKPDRRTIACLCGAYAANVLENAFVGLSHSQKEQAFVKVDEMLKLHTGLGDKAKSVGTTEVMAGVSMADVGSVANLAAPKEIAATQDKAEDKDTRRAFNYALVKFCDMSDEMRAEAVDMVVTAVEKHIGNYEAASKSIKESMDKRAGSSWHVVVGEGFGFEITHEMRNLLYMYFGGNLGILVWKSS